MLRDVRRRPILKNPHALPVVCTLTVFTASRLWAWTAGLRFDTSTLGTFWQFVDPTLLKTRLLESIWYLHAQPPLYNLALGIELKVSGSHFATVAHGSQICIGVVIALTLYALLVVSGVARWWAAGIASLFVVSPSALLYENWLFYEYLVAALVLLTALAFAGFERRPSVWRSFAIFAFLAALCYVRASFQIPLLLLVLALMLIVFSDRRRMILVGAAIPLLLVFGLYLKNWALFGVPATSSWTGMNLMQVALYGLSDNERDKLADQGVLSRVSLAAPFQPLGAYRGLLPAEPPRGIPVLDEVTKPSGFPNMNNIEYVKISQEQLHDFFRLLAADPGAYLGGVDAGLKKAATPSDDYFVEDRAHLRTWARLFDAVILWQPNDSSASGWSRAGWGIVVAYLDALVFGAFEFVNVIRRRRSSATLAFVWLLLAYTTVVVTFGEVSENERIRFSVDGLATVLVIASVARMLGRFSRPKALQFRTSAASSGEPPNPS